MERDKAVELTVQMMCSLFKPQSVGLKTEKDFSDIKTAFNSLLKIIEDAIETKG